MYGRKLSDCLILDDALGNFEHKSIAKYSEYFRDFLSFGIFKPFYQLTFAQKAHTKCSSSFNQVLSLILTNSQATI